MPWDTITLTTSFRWETAKAALTISLRNIAERDMISENDIVLQFLILPIILPFLFGLIMLILFRKDAASRLVAMVTLKPVIAYPVWFLFLLTDLSNNNFSTIVIGLIPAVSLTVGIVLLNRKVFFKYKILAAIFLGLDASRMLNTLLIWAGLGDEPPEPILFSFGLALPSLIAVAALVFTIARRVYLSRSQTSIASAIQ
jgi:hypothetical protein